MSKKPRFYNENVKQLIRLCDDMGCEYEFIDPYNMQMRIYGGTHVIDVWPSRMVYHRIKGEDINAVEPYHKGLRWQFNKDQVAYLLATGQYKEIK